MLLVLQLNKTKRQKHIIKRMFVELLQLNHNHEYSFDRDKLIAIMDEITSEN
jgi:hypothetical protein